MWVMLNKMVAFNAWKTKVNNVINKTSVLCGKTNESMFHRICKCMQAQKT
jgi:hypothetical protein